MAPRDRQRVNWFQWFQSFKTFQSLGINVLPAELLDKVFNDVSGVKLGDAE
jgi:hypothetical protein